MLKKSRSLKGEVIGQEGADEFEEVVGADGGTGKTRQTRESLDDVGEKEADDAHLLPQGSP